MTITTKAGGLAAELGISKSLFEWACLADPYLIPQ